MTNSNVDTYFDDGIEVRVAQLLQPMRLVFTLILLPLGILLPRIVSMIVALLIQRLARV